MTMSMVDGDRIVAALRGSFTHDSGRQSLLQLAADRLHAVGPRYTSVYMYMLHGDMLVLEAFAGRETEHTRIPVGRGVCGTAVAEDRDQNVGDVGAISNYISCNLLTRSELVVLIRRGPLVLGQIDIDSDIPGPFPDQDHGEVKKIADALAVLL
jgi:L-methionine (R)-S-oxide reductase